MLRGNVFWKLPNFLPKARPFPSIPPPFFRPRRSLEGEARRRFARARTRTPTHAPASVAFRFLPSPARHKQLFPNTLGVKVLGVNAFTFPSRSARLPSRQHEEEKEKTAKR